ncbi:MAG: hypothetical protein WD278_21140 [Pirellulales bacterium]
MTPIWKIRSGQFAGWYSSDAIYDALGRHGGYMAGTVAYSLPGKYLGEIYRAEWIGRPAGAHRDSPGSRQAGENVAHARLDDRAPPGVEGWDDPEF